MAKMWTGVTDGVTDVKPVYLRQPVNTSTCLICTEGNKHIHKEDDFKEKEENSTHYLTVIKVSKSEDKEGELYSPVTFCKGSDNVNNLVFYPNGSILNKAAKLENQAPYPTGYSSKEHSDIVHKS